MSKTGDKARLEFVLKMISDLETIVKNHGNVDKTLADAEGLHAALMCLLQIGEKLNRISDEELRRILPIKGAYGLRNIITHDYGSIDTREVAVVLQQNIPVLKKQILDLLK